MDKPSKQAGYIVTAEFLTLLQEVEGQGFTRAYLIREGLAMLLRERFGVDVPDEIIHPQLGGSRH